MGNLRLGEVLRILRKEHGPQPPLVARGAFEMAVWEACAYLVDDPVRRQTFEALRKQVGLAPAALIAAGPGRVAAAIAGGGMSPSMRAEKVLRAAELALEIGPEELQRAVELRPAEGKMLVSRFPGIGKPGAEKILMAHGSLRALAPESNGVRVLTRLGFTAELRDYAATYRNLARAIEPELPADSKGLLQAHLLLRRHGQTTCRRTRPECERCGLASLCAFFRTTASPRR